MWINGRPNTMIRVTTPLWSHQREMVRFTEACFPTGVFINAGMATGKTLYAYKLMEKHRRTLVVTVKAAMLTAWATDAEKHTDGLTPIILNKGSSAAKSASLRDLGDEYIIVVNYESWRLIKALARIPFDLIIADECHRLKANTSAISAFAKKQALRIPHRVGMSGTMWTDAIEDVWGQARFVNPVKRPDGYIHPKAMGNYQTFFDEYVVYYRHDNYNIINGYKNLDRLAAIIKPYTLRVTSTDVVDLPPVQDITIPVRLPKKVMQYHDEMKQHSIMQLEHKTVIADNPLVRNLRLQQITSGFDLDGNSLYKANVKVNAVLDLVEQLGKQPVVIFTTFKAEVEALYKKLPDALRLTGDVHQEMDFYNGRGNVLIANLSAGSTGVDLSRARIAIYMSKGYSRTQYEQSRYRLRRPNNLDPITFYHLTASGSIDIMINIALSNKEDNDNEFVEKLNR